MKTSIDRTPVLLSKLELKTLLYDLAIKSKKLERYIDEFKQTKNLAKKKVKEELRFLQLRERRFLQTLAVCHEAYLEFDKNKV